MPALAQLLIRHRAAAAAVLVVLTAISLAGIPRLEFDENPRNLIAGGDPAFDQLERLFGDFADDDRTCLIVVRGEDFFRPEAADSLRAIVRGVGELDGIQEVRSLLDVRRQKSVGKLLLPLVPAPGSPAERYDRARREAAEHPLVIGHLLSADMQTTVAVVRLEENLVGTDDLHVLLDRVRAVLRDSTEHTPLDAKLTGVAVIQSELVRALRTDQRRLLVLGTLFSLPVSILLFRRPAAVLVVTAGPLLGVLWTMGCLGLVGRPIDLFTNTVPVLILVIGTTDSIHLMLDIRRSLAAGAARLDAARDAIARLGPACALTSATTAAGFGSLAVSGVGCIQRFGLVCAVGVALSFLAVVTAVPLLAAAVPERRLLAKGRAVERSLTPWMDRLAGLLEARPRAVLAGVAALVVVLGGIALNLEANQKILETIPDMADSHQALKTVDREFGGAMFAYVVVQWPEGRAIWSDEVTRVLAEVHLALESEELLTGPLSVLDVLESLPDDGRGPAGRMGHLLDLPEPVLRRLVDLPERRALVSVHVPDVGTQRLAPALARVDERLAGVAGRHPGFHVELTGSTVVMTRNYGRMFADLSGSVAMAAAISLLVLWVGLRSFRLVRFSVLPNAFPLLVVAALIVLTGGWLENANMMVFAISLGIALDDTIHFLVRWRIEVQLDADPRRATRRTLAAIGPALIVTTAVLLSGPAAVQFSGLPAVRVFGAYMAAALVAALFGDLVILPAMLSGLTRRPSPPQGA